MNSSDEWKAQASALFFYEHLNIGTIAEIVKRKRETVSRHINGCEGYSREMAFRREQSRERRREYQKNWDRDHRAERYCYISGETMRLEHEMAVRELSRERFFG